MAQADVWLAHDFRETFDLSFHMLFPRAGLPMQEALVPRDDGMAGGMLSSEWRIADLISLIHLIDWPVVEPDRRADARLHLLAMIDLSRKTFAAIDAETDNEREWLPGPKQAGMHPLTGLEVGEAQVAAWLDALSLAEDVLEGRALIPHFRFADRGIDVTRFFDEPQPVDLVLMVTGPGAVPYLAQGRILTGEEFEAIRRRFGDQGMTAFAIWFN